MTRVWEAVKRLWARIKAWIKEAWDWICSWWSVHYEEAPEERRRQEVWRWRALTAWIVLFTMLTAYSLHAISNEKLHARERFANAIYLDCVRTNKLLTQLIRPGIENTSKLSYYKTHPLEREIVISQTKAALKLAEPARCKTLPIQKDLDH